jgi:hypothetical protein
MKFKKKPVVIEAIQWNGKNLIEVNNFSDEVAFDQLSGDLYVYTLEGAMKVSINDWIIRGIKGEIYPCKPDIFVATYDPVE